MIAKTVDMDMSAPSLTVSRSDPITHRRDAALRTLYNGGNCAQAVLVPFAKDMNMSVEDVCQIAEHYASGTYVTCGPILAMRIVLNRLMGEMPKDNPIMVKGSVWAVASKLQNAFAEELGGSTCREVRRIKSQNHEFACIACIEKATELLEEYLTKASKG